MTEQIRVQCQNHVQSIEINRPEKKNALTKDMYAAMAAALRQADEQDDVHVVLIHGQSDCFTAGNDLKDFVGETGIDEDTPVGSFIDVIPTIRKPIVAAVGGPAIGIGTTMLLHCDVVYAADNARFALPFVNLALVPEAASSMLLPRLTGYQRAAELVLLGDPFDAHKALSLGIVSRICAPDELLAQARSVADKLAQKAPSALLATKALLKRAPEPVADRIEAENREFATQLATPEAQEIMNAFLERRKPDFSRL